jgi:hypothetical protein
MVNEAEILESCAEINVRFDAREKNRQMLNKIPTNSFFKSINSSFQF